jgi:hypothetical protein
MSGVKSIKMKNELSSRERKREREKERKREREREKASLLLACLQKRAPFSVLLPPPQSANITVF